MPKEQIAEKKRVLATSMARGLATSMAVAVSLLVLVTSAFAASESVNAGGASAPPQSSESTSSTEATSEAEEAAELDGVSLATWYGPGLFGRHTACGQLLTKQIVGVANRTLPCGTLVAVSYRGKHATIPVIDRGPYSSIGANWDLTEGAAHLLHITETVDIKTKIVGHVKNTPELGSTSEPASGHAETESSSTGGASS